MVSGWEAVESIFWMVLEGGYTIRLPSSSIAVTLSAFCFQIDKKNKVPSDLEQVSVLWVERGGGLQTLRGWRTGEPLPLPLADCHS